jgi:iron-sulfur cluster assembly accessory protein
MMLTLTENAQQAIARFIRNADTPVTGLRVCIREGGCSGLQYALSLVEGCEPGDLSLQCGEITVFVEPGSRPLLEGVQVDFVDGLNTRGFAFQNPNATQNCNCGHSFSA